MKGNAQQPEGYTLLEMIVVLGLLALVLSVTLPSGSKIMTLSTQSQNVARMLKTARMRAVSRNRETVVEVDLSKNEVRLEGETPPLVIGSRARLSMLTAREETKEGIGAIRFFPDGSSTGGTIKIQNNRGAVAIHVDWLTGRVSQDSGHGAAR